MYLTDGMLFFFSFLFLMDCSDHLGILSFKSIEIYKSQDCHARYVF